MNYNRELSVKLKNSIIPDIILLKDTPVKDFDYVALKYDREIHNTLILIFMKSDEKKFTNRSKVKKLLVYLKTELKNYKFKHSIQLLKNYSIINEVSLYNTNENDFFPTPFKDFSQLIKKIKDCGIGHTISGDLFCDIYNNIYGTGGLRPVQEGGKWGYVNVTGKIVIEPQFDGALKFSEGFAGVKFNDKWGFINRKCNFIIEPQFDGVDDFIEGSASVKINGKWGFINSKGKIIMEPEYDQY